MTGSCAFRVGGGSIVAYRKFKVRSGVIVIRKPTPLEIETLIPLLNEEFVYSKQRKLPIEKRFPELFSENNFENLYGLYSEGDLASFVAVKPVNIYHHGKIYKAFFVGAVFTDYRFRGKGYSSQLMEYVQNQYASAGADFGVLWTGINGFYEKLGWITADTGVFVTCRTLTKTLSPVFHGAVRFMQDSDISSVDAFRKSQRNSYVIRAGEGRYIGYRTVYSPGESLLRLVEFRNDKVCGYLLGSLNEGSCIIYEVVAVNDEVDVVSDLLSFIHDNYGRDIRVRINHAESDLLARNIYSYYQKVDIIKTEIQMYYPCNNARISAANELYISFADRI